MLFIESPAGQTKCQKLATFYPQGTEETLSKSLDGQGRSLEQTEAWFVADQVGRGVSVGMFLRISEYLYVNHLDQKVQ
jgi:hypothetical protein